MPYGADSIIDHVGQLCCMMKHFFFKIFGNMEKIPTFVLETNRLGNG